MRRITGIQLHHSVALEDATRGVANACAGLTSAVNRTADRELLRLEAEAKHLARRIGRARDEAKRRLQEMPVEQVVECREGRQPWPDEIHEGFQPRCSCWDNCQVHNPSPKLNKPLGDNRDWKCQCGPCPAHPEGS